MELTEQAIADLRAMVSNCIERLYNDDGELIYRGGMEQTAATAFAMYLRDAVGGLEWLKTLRVDVEYIRRER
jgi:hypothetical protein